MGGRYSCEPHSGGRADGGIGRRRYWRILLLVCCTFGVCAIDRSDISLAAPAVAKDFDVTAVGLGVVLSAFFWGYVPLQIPSALFGQYRSAKWLIFGGLVGWSVATLLCGLSRSVGVLGPASGAIYIIGVALLVGCGVTVLIYLGARRCAERLEVARA